MPKVDTVSTKLQRIADLARNAPDMSITSLSYHIDVEFLREAYRRTRKDGAPGVDGLTGRDYAASLEENLQSLLDRFKSGRYFAPPVRRTYIPKDGGKTRPLGIPTFEDKVLQRAVLMVMEAVYEQDFYHCSYGFRPGRSQHQALEDLWRFLHDIQGGWVLEVDLQAYFDTLHHRHLRAFLDKRVRDGVLRRTVDKWLKAGIMEEGKLRRRKEGTPQGGVISPLLANIYLHEALDRWFYEQVAPRMTGPVRLFRFADDFIVVLKHKKDAERLMEVLPKRMERFGLTVHPEKTRLVHFDRPPGRPKGQSDRGTFDFLGFTHYWGTSRKGHWTVKRKTRKSRLARAVRAISAWCRANRHLKVREQHRALCAKIRGHYGYYGITGNWQSLSSFLFLAKRAWKKWLSRRSQRTRRPWDWFRKVLATYPLPQPRIVHSALA